MSPQATPWLLLALAAVAGLFVGSFLNLCIFRLPRNCMNLFRGPRGCPGCPRKWEWRERIPIAGWFVNLGRCPACHHQYGFRPPVVELLTAAMFVFCAWKPLFAAAGELTPTQRGVMFVIHAWVSGVMIISTFINLDWGILPDEMTMTGVFIMLGCSMMFPFPAGVRIAATQAPWLSGLLTSLAGAIAGGGLPLLMIALSKLQYGREGLGMGVVKYSAMLGSVLGPVDAAYAFTFAVVLGCIFGMLKTVPGRKLGYVQFGPFQSLGALPMIFWSPETHRYLEGAFGLLFRRHH